MSKSSVASAPKLPSALPSKSAWAKGPPQNTSAANSPRSQSPAPLAHTPSHSRRPSAALSTIAYKDGVAVNSKQGPPVSQASTIKFGSVSDKTTLMSPPSDGPSPAIPASRIKPVTSFGTIDANPLQGMNGNGSISSASSSMSTASGTSTAATTPASTPSKTKFDVSALFRSTSSQSSSNSSAPESLSSPTMRPQVLSPQGHPHPLSQASGPPGPSPLAHQPLPQGGPSQAPMYSQHPPMMHQNMRQQSNVNMANAPRSPNFRPAMANGVGPGPRPAGGNVQPGGPHNGGMPSPRMGNQPPHQTPQMPHQMPPQMPPVQMQPGAQPNMPPNMQNMQQMQYPGWQYYYYPGAEYPQMYQHPWPQMQHVPGAPQPPPALPQNMPISPRPPPATLQTPASPPPNPQQTPVRLNSTASSFVPGAAAARSKGIKITDPSGHEVNFNKGGASPRSSVISPSPPPGPGQQRRMVRLESEDEKKRRVAEEEARNKVKQDAEARVKREREEREAAARKAAEEHKEKERLQIEEEQRKKDEAEKERLRKIEEEEKRKKADEEEKERARLAEEERLRKEAEEIERLRKEKEEKERLDKEAEKARLAAEEKARKELEEKKKEEDRKRSEDDEAKAKIIAEEEKAKVAEAAVPKATDKPADTPLSTSPESHKRRPIPGPLDLSSTTKPNIPQPLPSALATARHIQDLGEVSYPAGIQSPRPDLNENAKDGKFRYDRDFLMQFMKVCTEKPDNLPNLEAIGLEPVDSHALGRTSSGRRGGGGSMGPPSARSASASLGLGITGGGFNKSSFAMMGSFSTVSKLSEERYMRSTSMGASGMPSLSGRPSPMVRSNSQGGPNGFPGSSMGNKRVRSKRGEPRGDRSMGPPGGSSTLSGAPLEPVAPLQATANRWVPGAKGDATQDSPEIIDRKVRGLLNKLTQEHFSSISDQIITYANKSEKETNGQTLIQVIGLVFQKATDEAHFSEMYARLCRKMMELVSPNVQDEEVTNKDGSPVTGGQLFRKYLLNRCQEDFERGWSKKKETAAAAAAKAGDDQAVKEANEKDGVKEGEEELYSDEYYAAQKAKRQGLGLVRFIGELFKLKMLKENIMHGCIKHLLNDIEKMDEDDAESLCKLLTTVGQALDESKSDYRPRMNIYFDRMQELIKRENIPFRMKSMVLDVIELRARKWQARADAPKTAAGADIGRHDMSRSSNMSRGGSRRGVDRDPGVGPDGWAVAGGAGPSRPAAKAGDLSHFGKINKTNANVMSFGPSSVFSKKDAKRDSGQLSRTSSSSNMFHMLSQNPDVASDAVQPSSRQSRGPSRTASVDISSSVAAEIASSRPRLNLLPRSKPVADDGADKPDSSVPSEVNSDDDDDGKSGSSMSVEKAEAQAEKDSKEFFGARILDEAESYFTSLPAEHHHILVEKVVTIAIEKKEADVKLVASFFARAVEKNLCSASAFEEGFLPVAEMLDDIAIDAPKAFDFMAMMMKGASTLDEEQRTRIAGKSEDSEKLLTLLA